MGENDVIGFSLSSFSHLKPDGTREERPQGDLDTSRFHYVGIDIYVTNKRPFFIIKRLRPVRFEL